MPGRPAPLSKRRILGNVLLVSGAAAIAATCALWPLPTPPARATLRPPESIIATRAVTPESIDDYRFRLLRTGCLGPCPVFTIDIDSSGIARYAGPDHRRSLRDAPESKSILHRKRQLSAGERVELAKLVEHGNFWSLKPTYDLEPFPDPRTGDIVTMEITDNPGTIVTVWRGAEMKSVSRHIVPCLRDYPGPYAGDALLAMPHAIPDVFCQLTDAIEHASCAGAWGRIPAGDDSRPPPQDPRCEGAP